MVTITNLILNILKSLFPHFQNFLSSKEHFLFILYSTMTYEIY